MHTPTHTVIGLLFGAAAVSVPTPIEQMFTLPMVAAGAIFVLKALVGGGISVWINSKVDKLKSKRKEG